MGSDQRLGMDGSHRQGPAVVRFPETSDLVHMRVTVAVDVLMREATMLVECFNVLISRGLGWGHDDNNNHDNNNNKVHAVCRDQEAASAPAHKGVKVFFLGRQT